MKPLAPFLERVHRRSRLFSLSLLFAALTPLIVAPDARALPLGGQVAAGSVTTTLNGAQLTLAQASRAAVMNWRSFDIASHEAVRLLQPGADAALLARVTGGNPTELLGSLKADGKLFLINPKGILVGQGAVIDTAAFLASTLDVADADFLKGGPLTFKGDSTAGVVNLGTITAREGNVLLLAHTVKNAGAISAPHGTAGLGAGTEVYLASPDAPDFVVKTNLTASAETSAKVGVDNSGTVAAAQAQLEAAGGSLYDLAVNQSGTVRATGIERTPDGRVLLTAGGGNVSVTGTISARDADGSGGEILVGGDQHGGQSGRGVPPMNTGGTPVPHLANAARTTIGPAATLDASAASATGAGGKVVVWADGATRFLGSIVARGGSAGGDGGFAEVSGKHQLDFSPAVPVDLSSSAGHRGTLLLDPDALVVSTSADSGTSTSGTDPFVFGPATEPATLNVTTLQNQLATTDVTLDTSTSAGDVTFDAPITWASDSTLRVNAGNNINLNANVTAAAGTLALYAGRQSDGDFQSGVPELDASVNQAATSTLDVGTLTVGMNTAAAVPGEEAYVLTHTGAFSFNGNLHAGTVNLDLTAGGIGTFVAGGDGTDTEVGTLQTIGTTSLSGGSVGYLDFENTVGDLSTKLVLANSATDWLEVATPGDLTVQSGSALSFADETNAVFASTTGNVINQAGVTAFGENARFLIYSGTSDATVKGGLSGTEIFSSSLDSAPPEDVDNDDVSRFFYRATTADLPNLTYKADDLTREYGLANPALTYSVTGFEDGVTDDVTGAPALSTTATVLSGVDTYAISISQGTLASANYGFLFAPGTLTVTAAPLTLTVNNASRTYGAADPAFSFDVSGLRNGDPVSAAGSFGFQIPATRTSDVGNYAINLIYQGGADGNYALDLVPGTLSISKAPLSLAVADSARTYGAANPAFFVNAAGLVAGDSVDTAVSNLAFQTDAVTASPVGNYAVTATGTSSNYTLAFLPGTLTVNPAPLTITAGSFTRLYGDPNPAFTASYDGFVNGEDPSVVTGLQFSTMGTTAAGVGAYAIDPSNASAPNYAISYVPGTLTIDKAPLTVRIADITRPYGTTAIPYALGELTGLKNSDTASVIQNLAFHTLTPVPDGALPGSQTYTILATGTAANYNLTWEAGLLSIGRGTASITVGNRSKVYGTIATPPGLSFSGFLPTDQAAAAYAYGVNNPDTQQLGVGTYTFGLDVLQPASIATLNALYDITLNPGTLTVTPATLRLVARDVTTPYGDPAGPNGYDIFDLYPWDSPSVVTGTQLADVSVSGTAAPGTVVPITFASPGTAANYTIAAEPGKLTVVPRPMTVTAPDVLGVDSGSFPIGVVPTFPATGPAPLFNGPQFTYEATAPNLSYGSGTFDLVPRVVPAAGTTLATIEQYYAFTFVPGKLEVKQPPVVTYSFTFVPNDIPDPGSTNLFTQQNDIRVEVADPNAPLTSDEFRTAFSQDRFISFGAASFQQLIGDPGPLSTAQYDALTKFSNSGSMPSNDQLKADGNLRLAVGIGMARDFLANAEDNMELGQPNSWSNEQNALILKAVNLANKNLADKVTAAETKLNQAVMGTGPVQTLFGIGSTLIAQAQANLSAAQAEQTAGTLNTNLSNADRVSVDQVLALGNAIAEIMAQTLTSGGK